MRLDLLVWLFLTAGSFLLYCRVLISRYRRYRTFGDHRAREELLMALAWVIVAGILAATVILALLLPVGSSARAVVLALLTAMFIGAYLVAGLIVNEAWGGE